MGGGPEADGTITRSDAAPASESSWRAPPLRRAPLAKPSILIAAAVAIAVVLGVTGVVVLTSDAGELEANGRFIGNAREALRTAEAITTSYIEDTDRMGGDVAVDGDIRCWFAYEDGADAPEELWCGTLKFADSAPGTHWLTMPVGFSRDGERVMAEPDMPAARRTRERSGDVDLRRPDGRAAPDDDEVDLERPDVPQADTGTVGNAYADEVAVEMEEPDDGRLHGVGYSWEITGAARTDRVRLTEDDLPGPVTAPADGEEWLLVGIGTELTDTALAETTLDAAIVVDGDHRIPVTEPGPNGDVMAVAIPEDADSVVLEVNDGHLTHTWDFAAGTRSGGAEVLYRDEDDRTVTLDQEFPLPFGARDLNPVPGVDPVDLGEYGYLPGVPGLDMSRPFGEVTMTLKVGGARLDYAMQVRGRGDVSTTFHSAGAPDRALLFLTGVEAEWSELGLGDYKLPPESAILTLPDGTQIPATRPGGEPEFGSFLDLGLDGTGLGSGSGLAWNVPAGIEKATLTLTFPTQQDELFELDFQNATVTIDLDFSS